MIRDERKPFLTKAALELDGKCFEFKDEPVWACSSGNGIGDSEYAFIPDHMQCNYPIKSGIPGWWPTGDLQSP